MNTLNKLKGWIKKRDTSIKRVIYASIKRLLRIGFPAVPVIHLTLYGVLKSLSFSLLWLINTLYWKPVFICWLNNRPKNLLLYGRGLPYLAGPLDITIGDDCRVSTQITVCGRTTTPIKPKLSIGDNVDIGWGSGIYVGTHIHIGNNVRIAGQGTLAGYPGHPIDAVSRAMGDPDTDDQARDIILEDDVWLARSVIVNAGVTIGRGTIVAAGSVVTKNLPAGVLAGGVPAKVIKIIESPMNEADTSALERIA